MIDERGSAALIVIVSAVALFAMGAVVVDVAALLEERRTLQNGADAAAFAIAQTCSAGACGDAAATASSYADLNAGFDAAAEVEELCGDGVDGAPACTDPPSLPAGAHYVRVTATTDDGSGGHEVAYRFARVFGLTGSTVHARATVAWGGPAALESELPVTMSQCEYDAYTAEGTDLAPPPPYPTGYPTPEAVIYLHDTTGADPCPSGPAGSDLPGGFGWLETSTDCTATSDTTGWFDDSTGRPPPSSCTPTLMAALVGTIVHLPIFDQTNGLTGTNGTYHMGGFASFFVTGYSIVGQYKEASIATGQYPCSGQTSCISGFFVEDPEPVEGTVGGAGMGVVVISLIE